MPDVLSPQRVANKFALQQEHLRDLRRYIAWYVSHVLDIVFSTCPTISLSVAAYDSPKLSMSIAKSLLFIRQQLIR